MFRFGIRSLGLAAVLAALFTVPAFAQDGKITGKVVDATGGALPGVSITITEQTSGATKTAYTAGDGTFSIDAPPGVYTVTADLRGFRRGLTRDITIAAGASRSEERRVGQARRGRARADAS